MREICPYCMDEKNVKIMDLKEKIKVRGELYPVTSKVLCCNSCKKKFNTKNFPNDTIENAFAKYREKHKLLTPAEIQSFRKEINLTQSEFSKVLGWGGATLSRYEGGALQEKSHDNSLRMAMTVDGMTTLKQQIDTKVKKESIQAIDEWIEKKKYIESPHLSRRCVKINIERSIAEYTGARS